MKNTVTIIRSEFGCDNCSASVKDLDHFPYEDGWRYLFALDARVGSKGVNFTVKDKQFCSFKCFLEFKLG